MRRLHSSWPELMKGHLTPTKIFLCVRFCPFSSNVIINSIEILMHIFYFSFPSEKFQKHLFLTLQPESLLLSCHLPLNEYSFREYFIFNTSLSITFNLCKSANLFIWCITILFSRRDGRGIWVCKTATVYVIYPLTNQRTSDEGSTDITKSVFHIPSPWFRYPL